MIYFIMAVVTSVLLAVCTALEPVYIQNTINACMDAGKSAVLFNFAMFVLCVIGILIFEALRKLSYSKYAVDKTRFLKTSVLKKILMMDVEEFQKEKGQNYMTMLNQEIDMVVNSFYVQVLDLVYCILVLITSTLALISINPILAAIILVSAVVPILVSSLLGGCIERHTNAYVESLRGFNVMIGNLIHGYTTVKVNKIEDTYSEILDRYNRDNADKKFKESKTETFINMLVALLFYAGKIALIGVSVFLIAKGKSTVGALIGALQISEMLSIPVNSIAYEIGNIRSVRSIKEKIMLMLQEERQKQYGTKACSPIKEIEFQNVSFRYEEKYILKNVSVKFEAKKKYMIIGENGSGKSTMFKLLCRFTNDYEGKILVNGIDLRELDASYYEQIGIILQNPFLFNDSLYHNITLYGSEDEKDVRKLLYSLGMDKFLAEHNLQDIYVDTKDNISGGEKQKLALARILLKQKNFILLDEATAAIDKDSSLAIEKALLEKTENTVINVEHKIIEELLPLYDEIYELKEGAVIKRTPHFQGTV